MTGRLLTVEEGNHVAAFGTEVLARLVDASLVQPVEESGRHRMLEPVRQYAEHRFRARQQPDNGV